MPSVRVKPNYNEQGSLPLTFQYDASIIYDASYYDANYHNALLNNAAQGVLVTLVADGTAGLGTTGGYPLGKLIKVEPNVCTVEVGGTMIVPYVAANANPPLFGRGIIIDGAGNALTPAGGARLATERGIVLSVDSVNQVCKVLFGGGGTD